MSLGTVAADTLQDGLGNTVPMTTAISGSAKAWANFTPGATPTLNAAFNVSSITRIAAGDYTVNFTNAMPDTKYGALMTFALGNNNADLGYESSTTPRTTGACTFFTGSTTGAAGDMNSMSVAIFR